MPISYFGSKKSLARWIVRLFPQHLTYVEPFCGSASVFHAKRQRSRHEHINDLYLPVINFHRCVRDDVDTLIDSVAAIADSYKLHDPQFDRANPYQSAAEFYLYSLRSFAGAGTRWSTGERTEAYKIDFEDLRRQSWRLKDVEISSIDGVQLIDATGCPNTLIYVDPPYLKSVRASKDNRAKDQVNASPRRQYAIEMLEEDEHHRLLSAMLGSKSMLILSGEDSPLYREMLDGWTSINKKVGTVGRTQSVETIWISPNAQKMLDKSFFTAPLEPKQLSFFAPD